MTAAPAIYWQSIVINHQKTRPESFSPGRVFVSEHIFYICSLNYSSVFSSASEAVFSFTSIFDQPPDLISSLLCFSRKRDNDPIFFHSKTLTDDLYIFLDLAAVDLV